MFRKILMVIATALFIFGISKMSFAMMCGGHSQHQQTAQAESAEHKHKEHEVTIETTKEAISVGNKICPVSGEKINEKMKATYEYEGKTYNFCCPMCIDEFKKDPKKYIKKAEEELQKEKVEERAEGPSETHGHGEHSHTHY